MLRTSKRTIGHYLRQTSRSASSFRNKMHYRSIRGMYPGSRAFVIGNGPSLQIEDLSRLKDEKTIASNKIYLAFEKTVWRPTLFTIQDPLVWQKCKNELCHHFNEVHVENTEMLPVDSNLGLTVRRWHSLGPTSTPYAAPPAFSGDMSKGAYGGYTVTFLNLQLAVHLGCDPIYLIGCDHYYQGEEDLPVSSQVVHLKQNHFIEGYRKPGEIVYNAPIRNMTEAYRHAKAYADVQNIRIYNATRGGHLEVFERVPFDDLFD
jgi:hypothetical protein